MFHYVYQIENLINGKIYVGKHSTEDLDDGYMGSGKLLTHSIAKHGIENFRKYTIKMCESSEEAFELEKQLVTEEFIANENTYNIALGGCGSWHNANEHWVNNPELKKQEGVRLCTQIWSDQNFRLRHARRASEVCKKRLASGDFKQCDWTGRRHNEDTKRKIGIANSRYQSGSGNSQFGTIWVFCPKTKVSQKIKKEELDSFISEGWIRGRKMKLNHGT
jgi:hypothetical protein